jgi:hypothetical protein
MSENPTRIITAYTMEKAQNGADQADQGLIKTALSLPAPYDEYENERGLIEFLISKIRVNRTKITNILSRLNKTIDDTQFINWLELVPKLKKRGLIPENQDERVVDEPVVKAYLIDYLNRRMNANCVFATIYIVNSFDKGPDSPSDTPEDGTSKIVYANFRSRRVVRQAASQAA